MDRDFNRRDEAIIDGDGREAAEVSPSRPSMTVFSQWLFLAETDSIDKPLVVVGDIQGAVRARDQSGRTAQDLALLHPSGDEIFHARRFTVLEHDARDCAWNALFARRRRRA